MGLWAAFKGMQLGMDVVALPHCPAFEVLLKIVNPGKIILGQLWRTWPGADQEDCWQEVVEWMAGNLMTTYKVNDFFDVFEQKVTDNIPECMRMADIAPGPDSGKRIPTKQTRQNEKKAGKRDKKAAKSEKKKKEPRKKKTKTLPEKEKEPPTKGKQAPTKAKDATLSEAQKYYIMLREATKDDPVLFLFVAKYNSLCGDDKTDVPRCHYVIKELSRSSLTEI